MSTWISSLAAALCLASCLIAPSVLAEQDPRIFVVEDNGMGIDSAHQAVIFEKFRQVGDPLTAKPAGTGLGLAITYGIVERHGGSLSARNAPGGGAVFRLRLPLSGH